MTAEDVKVTSRSATGGDSVSVGDSEGNNAITLGNGADDSVLVGDIIGGHETITLGNGAGDSVRATDTSSTIITLGNGIGDSVSGSGGNNDMITLGNGSSDSVTTNRTINSTIALGNGNGDVVDDSPGNGNNMITLGNGNDTVYAGANETIGVGKGNDQLVAAPGDLWTVGRGQDTFTFDAGFGANTIMDFNTSHDVLQLAAALFPNYAAVMADTQQVGANSVITYDLNDTITLTGVAASHLTMSNFKFT
jgi:Ca2+-binding RTX toxin-like protein